MLVVAHHLDYLRRCREKIVQGRVDKIAKTMALLEQPFIKDTNKTVGGAS